MTTTAPATTSFTVRFSAYRGLLLAALCVFLAAAFVFDVQRGASRTDASTAAELRS